MKYSIAGIMNMNMFGIPLSGADVCGFFGEKRDD
jgi:alpha-glucosidase (family GH31 glycosyl hydrolase)